jgi:hypothetical protein
MLGTYGTAELIDSTGVRHLLSELSSNDPVSDRLGLWLRRENRNGPSKLMKVIHDA